MDLDIRYAAGLFDGEGWITICKQKLGGRYHYNEHYVRYQLQVGITMTNRPVVEAVHQTFGGNFFNVRSKALPQARLCFGWKLSSGLAAEFLAIVEPHLIVKRDEALIAIEFQKHVRAHTHDFRYRPELRQQLYAEREVFHANLLAFKKRTFSPIGDDPISIAA